MVININLRPDFVLLLELKLKRSDDDCKEAFVDFKEGAFRGTYDFFLGVCIGLWGLHSERVEWVDWKQTIGTVV